MLHPPGVVRLVLPRAMPVALLALPKKFGLTAITSQMGKRRGLRQRDPTDLGVALPHPGSELYPLEHTSSKGVPGFIN